MTNSYITVIVTWRACDAQVSEQPLSFGALTVNGRREVRYNVRKLSELPYHLIESSMHAELRKHVLFNYDWLHSKLAATSLPDLLADFHMATTAFGDAGKVRAAFGTTVAYGCRTRDEI